MNLLVKQGEKVRNATCIVWLEDLERLYPDNPLGALYSLLASLKCRCACSPVHDRDEYDESDVRHWQRRKMEDEGHNGTLESWVAARTDGETGRVVAEDGSVCPEVGQQKKPHIHVVFFLKGPQPRNYFTDLMCDLVYIRTNAWQRVLHPDSMIRYLAHLDSEDKYHYSELGVKGFGGIDLSALLREDDFSRTRSLCDIHKHITDNGVKHYAQLVRWAFGTGDYEIINLVVGRASYYANFFRSQTDERVQKAKAAKLARDLRDGKISEDEYKAEKQMF